MRLTYFAGTVTVTRRVRGADGRWVEMTLVVPNHPATKPTVAGLRRLALAHVDAVLPKPKPKPKPHPGV